MPRQWMAPGIIIATAMLGLLASATATAAQNGGSNPEASRGLVAQCHEQALKGPAGDRLQGKPLEEKTNAPGYEPGKPYELHINLHGHGNVYYNVICRVDAQGNVSFESVDESGQAHE